MNKNSIRIKLNSFDSDLLQNDFEQLYVKLQVLLNTLSKINFISQSIKKSIVVALPLPKKKRIFCVLRSPHVNKDSREHFEIRTYRRLIIITYISSNSIFLSYILDIIRKHEFQPGVSCRFFKIEP
uniref:Small ribosomal subunit protein uS10c n=1 Tax=Astrosyne radiata TaxID=1158023 RepID=A0A2U9NTB5_9STRA|nr:ribosomal protein S10 [Astrosyne radiata]AWT40377.1 ribosomal protein S10 [Astrosyne radiata]